MYNHASNYSGKLRCAVLWSSIAVSSASICAMISARSVLSCSAAIPVLNPSPLLYLSMHSLSQVFYKSQQVHNLFWWHKKIFLITCETFQSLGFAHTFTEPRCALQMTPNHYSRLAHKNAGRGPPAQRVPGSAVRFYLATPDSNSPNAHAFGPLLSGRRRGVRSKYMELRKRLSVF